MTITVGDDALGRAVALISQVCGHPLGQPAKGASTSAKAADGVTVTGLAACATALAAAAPAAADLLGRTPLEQAQVAEWLTWCTTELGLLLDDKLVKVNTWLESRTFLVADRLTLADLAVFGTVQPAVAAMPGAQTDQFCCLLRWFDLLQHLADPQQAAFPHRPLPLPLFVPPPPPAPPAAAPTASASGKGAAAADGKGSDASTATKGGAAAAASSSSSKAAPAAAAAKGAAAAADGAAAAGEKKDKGEKKKEKGEKKEAKAAAGGGDAKGGSGGDEVSIDMLDIRVGQIVSIGKHPNADALYLEEIDLGEDKPRQVISGLVKFVPEDQMRGRRVVVVTNLKPAKMRDVMSYGMVLCASNDAHDTVDPIIPPEGVPVGERITVAGYEAAPLPEVNPKKKILERLLPDMRTDANGVPGFKGVPFMTSKGVVTSTLPNAHVG